MVFVVANKRNAGCGRDDLRLVEQRQLSRHFQHALDHEHHVRAARIVLIEAQRDVALQRPGKNAFPEFSDLLAVFQHDRVLADEINTRHMAVEVDAHARPIQPRRHLFDVRRLTGAVIALDHHAAVVFEAGENRQRHIAIEQIVGIEIRHVLVGLGVGRHFEIAIDAEDLADGELHVRQQSRLPAGGGGWLACA